MHDSEIGRRAGMASGAERGRGMFGVQDVRVRNSPIAPNLPVTYAKPIHTPWGGIVMQFAVFSAIWFAVSILAVLTLV